MLDWRRETLVPVASLAKRFGKSHAQIYAWVGTGLRGPSRKRIRLETVKLGTLHTSEEALDRFFEAISPRATALPKTAAQREREERAIDAEMEAAGW